MKPSTLEHPGDYEHSDIQIELVSDDGRLFVGRAIRTGVTPPGTPDHPVYRFEASHGQELPDGLFIWDGTMFTKIPRRAK